MIRRAGRCKRIERQGRRVHPQPVAVDLLRRTIDDAFRDVDLVVLRPAGGRRHVDASISARKKTRRAIPSSRTPAPSTPMASRRFPSPAASPRTAAGGADDRGAAVFGGQVLALARAFEQATDFHTSGHPFVPTRRCLRSPRLKIPRIRADHTKRAPALMSHDGRRVLPITA